MAKTRASSSLNQPGAADGVNDVTPSDRRPTKRAKTSRNAENGTSAKKRKKGRLGDLSDLPLDIWHEVFLHLDPADLLHLARTTRAFRKELLSRQQAFIWRAALDRLDPECWPPCPEDMSEPAWVNLIWGGPYCFTCNGKAMKIAWTLRRRVCKACADTKLFKIPPYFLLSLDRRVFYDDILPSVEGSEFKSKNIWKRRRTGLCAWEDDYKKIQRELERLGATYSRSTVDVEAFVRQQSAKREAVEKHAELCMSLEEKRSEDRSEFLSNVKVQRYQEIQNRLRDLGYDAVDIASDEVYEHKDVKAARPLTDKVWLRIEPSLRAAVEAVRDQRLAAIKARRREEHTEMAAAIYLSLLRLVAPSTVSFMPSIHLLLEFEWIANAIETDSDPSKETFEVIEDAIYGSLADIEQWVFSRARQLQELLPETWRDSLSNTMPESLGASVVNSTPKLLDFHNSFTPLDLAVHTFECYGTDSPLGYFTNVTSLEHWICFGLDALALRCRNAEKDVLPVHPNQRAHNAVLHILELLGLNPARTSPLELDRLQKTFICEDCSSHSDFQALTWRKAIYHHCSKRHAEKPPNFRCATPLECLYVKGYYYRPATDLISNWGCVHCSAHFNQVHDATYACSLSLVQIFDRWFTYGEVKRHLNNKHRIRDVVEGRDAFTNRQVQHFACDMGLSTVGTSCSMRLSALERIVGQLSNYERVQVNGSWNIDF